MITADDLARISLNPDPAGYDLAGDAAALWPEMEKAGITTKERMAAFLANVVQETDRLKTLEEYGEEAYFRSFLGDEWLYHGRGYIMNTWLAAYRNLSKVLGVDLVENPDRLAGDKELAARAAVWFWTENGLNWYADNGTFWNVSGIINTGGPSPQHINGWQERVAAHNRAMDVLRGTEDNPPTGLTTVAPGTKSRKFLDYVVPLIGRMPYWVWVSGGVPDGEGAYAVNSPMPASSALRGKRIFCFVGDTEVFSPYLIEGSYKRWYDGEVVTIETAAGNKLTGSPNHPILTDRGWVGLGSIREGFNVLGCPDFGKLARPDPDNDDVPAAIESVHESLSDRSVVSSTGGRLPVLPLDFHGDGGLGKHDVQYAFPGDVLMNRIEPNVAKQAKHLGLPYPNDGRPLLSGFRNLGFSALAAERGHLESGGFRVRSSLDTGLLEPIEHDVLMDPKSSGDGGRTFASEVGENDVLGIHINEVGGKRSRPSPDIPRGNAGFLETPMDGASVHTDALSDLLQRETPGVEPDQVVGVNRRMFSGHVYNLQTESGWYLANGIIAHNCAGPGNIARRVNRKVVPHRGNRFYDGGIAAYFDSPEINRETGTRGFYAEFQVPFDLETAKAWARETRQIVLVGRPYRGPTLARQGHAAFLLPSGFLLQSFQFAADGSPGLTWDFTLEQSHDGGYYSTMVAPWDWLEHDKGGF